MSKFVFKKPVEHLPKPVEYPLTGAELSQRLKVLQLDNAYLWDSNYWYISLEDWGKVLKDVLFNMPKYTVDKFDCTVAPDLAYAMGLFFADGSCRHDGEYGGAHWNICNTKPELLEKCLKSLEREWSDLSFRIETYPSEAEGKITNYGVRRKALYHLQIGVRERHNNGDRGKFISDFGTLFYFDGKKQVPAPILESSISSKRQFLLGCIDGDGQTRERYQRSPRLGVKNKLALNGLVKLANDVNWLPKPFPEKRKDDFYYIDFNWRYQYDPLICEYLWGKETVSIKELNEHFGFKRGRIDGMLNRLERIGFIKSEHLWSQRRNVTLVKEWPNGCENFAMLVSARVSERYQLNTCGVAIGSSPWGEHGYNLLVHKDGLIYFEPQTGDYAEVDAGTYKARLVIFGG